jgi:hypothetical protein
MKYNTHFRTNEMELSEAVEFVRAKHLARAQASMHKAKLQTQIGKAVDELEAIYLSDRARDLTMLNDAFGGAA